MQYFFLISYQLRKVENAINRTKNDCNDKEKTFANIRDFAILAKITALFKLLLLELPIQRFPMVVTQFEEGINMEMGESLRRNVLKHNVTASMVYDLLGSCFQEIVQGFELKTDAWLCYISKLHGK